MALTRGAYVGPLYRSLNPIYARMPLSGHGAELLGGRFNPNGMPTLYSALDPVTAPREANHVGGLQPTILVSYRADIAPAFDKRGTAQLAAYGMTSETLRDRGWRLAMLEVL